MKASKVILHGECRIKVDFPYDRETTEKIKQVAGARWSKTLQAWHLPFSKEAVDQIQSIFPALDCSVLIVEKEERSEMQHVDQGERNLITIAVGQKKIILKMPKNEADIRFIGTIKYSRWNKVNFCWEITNYGMNLEMLKQYFGHRLSALTIRQEPPKLEKVSVPATPRPLKMETTSENRAHLQAMKNWMEHKRYSASTIDTYTEAVQLFLNFMHPKSARDIEASDMMHFVNEYIIRNKLSYSYQNQVINGAKLFFREVIKSGLDVEKFERPRREHKLPNVLSKEEVRAILSACRNGKHKAMLSLIYACGLRRSELLKLRPADIDSKRGLILIRQSKGKRDRLIPVSDKILNILREYYKAYMPKEWLFEGQKEREPYSETSLQEVLKAAIKRAGIKKPVTLHWLRHSYATHLLESGVDLRYIQELLGHKSSKTTEIYTHVSIKSIQKIISPFDSL